MFTSDSFVNGIFVICVNAPDCKIMLELIILSEIFLAFFIVSGPYFAIRKVSVFIGQKTTKSISRLVRLPKCTAHFFILIT
jgi:hypothetical protein